LVSSWRKNVTKRNVITGLGYSALAGLMCAVGLSAAAAAEPPAPLWIAVGKAGFVESVEPLAAKRREDGFRVTVSTKSVAETLASIPELAAPAEPAPKDAKPATRPAAFLLLVGDDEPGKEDDLWRLPAKRRDLYRWRAAQPNEYASDALWGDLDGDLVPDLAVGRIPARTWEEVDLAVRKILEYERSAPKSEDLRLVVWAGSPRYGAAVDAAAATTLLSSVQQAAPGWIHPSLLVSDARFPFCPWPPDQPGCFARQLKQGAILGALMGHASAERFSAMKAEGEEIGFGAAEARAAFADGPPAPPLAVMACDAGNFTRPAPCLAETLFFLPGGPVAVVAATTESHPLTNYFTGIGLLDVLGARPPRIGTLWLDAQKRAFRARNPIAENLLKNVEGKLDPEIDVAKLRRDQLLMYALLGDPATRLRFPEPLEASVEKTIDGWRWKAAKPEGATSIRIGLRPIAPRFPPARGKPDAEAARALFDEANALLTFTPLPAPPADAPWEGVVTKGGWLRLVATSPSGLRVTALKLE
jgi:hypothetical protein